MKIQPEELIEENQSAYILFQRGFPNKATLQTNTNVLKKIVCDYLQMIIRGNTALVETQKQEMALKSKKLHYRKNYYDADFEIRVNELVRRAKEDAKWVDTVLMTLVAKLMDRTKLAKTDPDYIKSTMVENSLKPLKKLFSMTDVPIAWGKITSQITDENDIKDQSRGYTLEELQTICKFCDPMERVMVKLGASSGIRAGAYDLKWGHILKVYQTDQGKYIWEPEDITESVAAECKIICGVLTVYADSTSEYYGFVTPEWLNDLEIYKQLWIKETNQIPKDNDPLFKKAGPLVRTLSVGAIRTRMTRVVDDSSIRVHLDGVKRKYNIPIFNGTRRFFNKQNKLAISKTSMLAQLIYKEYQMGHGGLIKLDKNYFKEHVSDLITEYLSTIPYVTISEENRALQKLAIETQKNSVLEQTNEQIKVTKEENEKLEKKMNNMQSQLNELASEKKDKTKIIPDDEKVQKVLKFMDEQNLL